MQGMKAFDSDLGSHHLPGVVCGKLGILTFTVLWSYHLLNENTNSD